MSHRTFFSTRPIAATAALLSCLALGGAASAASSDHGRPTGVTLAPLFDLTTQHGGHLERADLRSKPFIILFGYTSCVDFCPTALLQASLNLQQLGADGDRLPVLFVTVDPENDTVEHLETYLTAFDSRIVGLTGSDAEIAAVADAFQVPFRPREAQADEDGVEHSYMMFMVDKYGLLARLVGYDEPDELLRYSQRLLAQ